MTDRLSALLHQEADTLDVLAPPAATILARGRGLRRRRRATTALASTAVVAVLAGGAYGGAQLFGDPDSPRGLEPAVNPDLGAVFSVGTTVYLMDGTQHVTIGDKAIKSLYYTSVGVLVRHGNNPYSDGGGPQRFSLVREDGSVGAIDVVSEETVHATDPDAPYLAYAETVDGRVEIVVHDLTNDTEKARIPMPGDFRWGGWPAPPVALSGDLVYVGTEDTARTVNWRTGEVSEVDTIAPGYPDVSGGRSLQQDRQGVSVIDVATGESLLELPLDVGAYADLSYDGRYLRTGSYMGEQTGVEVYTVDSGEKVTLDEDITDLAGWTADGDVMGVGRNGVTVCSPTTGDCETTPLELEPGSGKLPDDLKLGGATYES